MLSDISQAKPAIGEYFANYVGGMKSKSKIVKMKEKYVSLGP